MLFRDMFDVVFLPNVKLSHPERATELRNAVAPSGVYEFGVTARG